LKNIGDAKTVEKGRSLKICVLSFPGPSALVANVLLYSLVDILEPICEKIYVVTSNIPKDKTFSAKIKMQDVKTAMHFRDTIRPRWWSTVLQFFKIVVIQMKMCWVLVKISKEIEIVIFYVGGANLFPPVLMAKVLRKKVITSAIGLGSRTYGKAYHKGFFSMGGAVSTMFSILERANFSLSNRIIVESEGVIDFFNLDKYRQKLIATGARYIDTDFFQIKKELRGRKNLIGYIGRLEEGKGVMNFVRAIPLILERHDNLKFFLGGHGPLYDRIKDELKNNNLSQKVKLTGWISHDKIADYLNELKLFILPSYSEGLPTGVLEAMACGTPVLATPVGGIPDIIKDGETGFILEDNSPEGIAENVIRVLEHQNLDEIVNNARNVIEKEYTYEAAVGRYRKILAKMELK
jgi:glycosyltransferase involved in cell wall biosynthesis